MIIKFLTAVAIFAALVWLLTPARRKVGRAGSPAQPRVPHAHDLEKCPRCGIWMPAGDRCDCKAAA